MYRLNYRIFELINNLALKNRVIDNVMIFSSKFLPYMMMLIICATFLISVFKHKPSNRKNAAITVLLIAVNLIINYLIGRLYYDPRPFVNHKVNLLFPYVRDSSFPSDHASATMSTAVGLMRVNRILGWASGILSLLVGFSRIYVGHHYPMDIIGSYLIVILTNILFHKFLEKKAETLYYRIEIRTVGSFQKFFHFNKN